MHCSVHSQSAYSTNASFFKRVCYLSSSFVPLLSKNFLARTIDERVRYIDGCINTVFKFALGTTSQPNPLVENEADAPDEPSRFMYKCVCYLPFLMENSIVR